MSERAERWGVLPSYWSYEGHHIQTSAETEAAILAAMGASSDYPPRGRRYKVAAGPCVPGPDRVWGWAVQLYSLRSQKSWGIGDMGDLRRFAKWSRKQGASVILLNPLGAQIPTLPYEASPYYASPRRFGQWAHGKGQALRDFATYNALAEAHGPAWRDWPTGLRHPKAAGVNAERRRLAGRVAFHVWQQFHLDQQMARAAREIGLITDVPVGFASDGFDAWRWQDLLVPDMRVGAPPDEFFRDGQDWGCPAFNPWKLR